MLTTTPVRATVAIALSAVLGLGTALLPTTAAQAAARVSLTNESGTAVADPAKPTRFTLRGSGFQSIKGGFGGIYVAFGWVRDPGGGGWRPSQGGITGRDYRYVPDAESGKNAGYLRFVAFPGSSTAGEAQAVMTGGGAFTVDLNVPGPRFTAVDRAGDKVAVDCLKVTCGVITFGAHGVKNARNETFTPVTFEAEPAPSATPSPNVSPSPTPSPSATPEPTAEPTSGPTSEPTAPAEVPPVETPVATPTPSVKPQVATERATARAGRSLAFTGRGFAPQEQVLALLDDGVVALGPLTAGSGGEVAGLMDLPADLPAGTHELRLVGAASKARPRERFAIKAADEPPQPLLASAATDATRASALEPLRTPVAIAGISALALLAALGVLIAARRRQHGQH